MSYLSDGYCKNENSKTLIVLRKLQTAIGFVRNIRSYVNVYACANTGNFTIKDHNNKS